MPPVLLKDEPLSRHSTFHAGGRSDLLVVESGSELKALVRQGDLPSDIGLVLGGGSNILISDEGAQGTVLVLRRGEAGTPIADPHVDDGLVWVDAASEWNSIALQLTQLGWRGLESMVGIPGTVGGAVVQSIGAYGYELCDLVVVADAVDLATRSLVTLEPEDIGFRYRDTDLKIQSPPRLVITRVALRLAYGGHHVPKYEELAKKLGGGANDSYPPPQVAQAVLELRTAKSMIYDPDDSQTWGAGSFFKNPELHPDQLGPLADRLTEASDRIPHWLIRPNVMRVSAGWLVERAGYRRGHRKDNVALNQNHALGIVNITGRASAREIVDFANDIRRAVGESAGVELEPEPVLVGLELASVPI